jgi:hypothetical protein
MPKNFQDTEIQWGDMKTSKRCCLTAMVWICKGNVNIRTHTHCPPVESNFSEDNGHALEPAVIQACNRCMWYMDKFNGITNSYSLSRWTLFFQLLHLTILKSSTNFASSRSKLTHRPRHKHRHKYRDNIIQILINRVVNKWAQFSWLRIGSCRHTNKIFWVP